MGKQVLLAVALVLHGQNAIAGGADDLTITATAPAGLRRSDLGRPYSSNFQPLNGKEGQALFPQAKDARAQATSLFDYQFVTVDNTHELRANASGWGVSVNARVTQDQRFLTYRAYLVSSIDEVDDRSEPRQVSPKASYYVRRIYYGQMVEYVCSASSDEFTADVRASFAVASGGIGAFERKHQTKCAVKGRGIEAPDTSNALFATKPSDIKNVYFGGTAKPVPILVEYRRVPNSQLEDYDETDWKAPPVNRARADNMLVVVDSRNSDWQSSGVRLDAGDAVMVVFDGVISLNKDRTKKARASQMEVRFDQVSRANGSVQVRIGTLDTNTFPIAGERFAFLATEAIQGEVKFRIQDSNHKDNDGFYKATVVRVPASLLSPALCVGADVCNSTPVGD